ncbi:hypothetical protein BH23BAC2_BH23BAC2_01340 [soil metagenome]
MDTTTESIQQLGIDTVRILAADAKILNDNDR